MSPRRHGAVGETVLAAVTDSDPCVSLSLHDTKPVIQQELTGHVVLWVN